MTTIESAALGIGTVQVTLSNREEPLEVSWIWLRDHCRCRHCYDAATNQRLMPVRESVVGGGPVEIDIVDGGAALSVRWGDADHRSLYAASLLGDVGAQPDAVWLDLREPWDATRFLDAGPEVDYKAFLTDEPSLAESLGNLTRFGFCFITGTPPDVEATRRAAERIGYVRESVFGGMWGFEADGARADSAYTAAELGPHTDATYSHDAPGLRYCTAYISTPRAEKACWLTGCASRRSSTPPTSTGIAFCLRWPLPASTSRPAST